jgi:hypothetical protein
MAELAELLGNSTRVCERYYSKWDDRRQDQLERNPDKLRANDLTTKMLTLTENFRSQSLHPVVA